MATPSNTAKPQAPLGSRGGGAVQETGNGEAQRGSREADGCLLLQGLYQVSSEQEESCTGSGCSAALLKADGEYSDVVQYVCAGLGSI
ncbi:KH domain-containing, RNA-binding, signal transduction-associated protein 3 [Sarotherodon galilaeus]